MDSETYRKTAPDVFHWNTVRMALQAAEEGVYCWEIDSGNIHYTERCLQMMGMPRHKLAPNIFTDPESTIHEDDVSFFRHSVERYLDTPTSIPMRIEVRLRNQSSKGWKWIRVNGLLERDASQKPVRLVGVWVDITRRKAADYQAREEKELFRTLIEHIPNSVYFKNRESRFVLANSATARKLGVPTPSDLIGKTDEYFFDESMCAISRAEEREIMESGRALTSRIHQETWKDRPDTWTNITKFPWYDGHGQLKGIVGISTDVTPLVEAEHKAKDAEKEIRAAKASLDKEIDLAREIQLSLLPYSIPARSWTSEDGSVSHTAAFHHIFTPSEGVAGDCFDVFPVGDSGVGMIICDVMGHGVRAALIASMLRGLMEQLSPQAGSPALFLSSLNRQLTRILLRASVINMFASALYVYLDLKTGRLTLSSAGHPSPILLKPGDRAEIIRLPRSLPLGLAEATSYSDVEVTLEPGSRLLLYTDGLTEAANAQGEELGVERVLDFLEKTRPAHIKDLVLSTFRYTGKFTGCSDLADDICLLGLEFDPTGGMTPSAREAK